ncbi:MAG: pantoate--beta-alanine ligase [Planctomycetes bacterium]|nr:pantoate--beta-alanine ligase [Planctomycetota bacterium]
MRAILPVHATAVYVGLGSNQGDRRANLERALERLAQVPGVDVLAASSFHESELVGDGPPQGAFLNGAVALRTTLPAAALLAVLKQLEVQAGRVLPAQPNHPRPLDLDLLFYGDRWIDTAALVVPHPRWHEREFVRRPLAELGLDLETLPRWQRPRVAREVGELWSVTAGWLAGGCTIGLVPTMGSLHEGHASLLRRARAECDRVVATVFVNPLQFGPGEDFAAYPRDLGGDLAVCAAAGVDLLFAPDVAQMYGDAFASHVAVGREAEGMEGALRPGHFAGVATVVARLFAMARPHRAYFGEKDAQQLAVIRRMTLDLGFPLEVVPCPIVREADGLAMSSRNVYLGDDDRRASAVLHRAMQSAAERFRRGLRDRDALLARVRAVLATEPRAAVDYVELRREGDLAELPPGDVDGGRLLVAARFSDGARPVRLLDNLSLVDRVGNQAHD